MHDPEPEHGSQDTLAHLAAHHGDFANFRDLMQQTSAGRFGPLWWGVWAQHVTPNLPASPTLLDLGCGPGGLFAPLRAYQPDARIIAMEIQPMMVAAAREEAERTQVEVVEADLNDGVPLPDGSVDAVAAVMLIHELPYPVPLLAEIARVLAPGGSLLIFDWASQPLRRYAADEPLTRDLIEHFREHCLWTPDDLAYLCERQGLQVLEVIARRGGDHAMVVVRKPQTA